MMFGNVSGGRMGYYGANKIVFKAGESKDKLMSLRNEVIDVQKLDK